MKNLRKNWKKKKLPFDSLQISWPRAASFLDDRLNANDCSENSVWICEHGMKITITELNKNLCAPTTWRNTDYNQWQHDTAQLIRLSGAPPIGRITSGSGALRLKKGGKATPRNVGNWFSAWDKHLLSVFTWRLNFIERRLIMFCQLVWHIKSIIWAEFGSLQFIFCTHVRFASTKCSPYGNTGKVGNFRWNNKAMLKIAKLTFDCLEARDSIMDKI